jgi:hypothetical protein
MLSYRATMKGWCFPVSQPKNEENVIGPTFDPKYSMPWWYPLGLTYSQKHKLQRLRVRENRENEAEKVFNDTLPLFPPPQKIWRPKATETNPTVQAPKKIKINNNCAGYYRYDSRLAPSCKENGPRAIWLNRFWCLMINITCGLMYLLVFVFVVHRMLKLLGPRHWGKEHLKRRHNEDQAKSKKQKKCCLRTVSSRALDCPVPHDGLSSAPGTVAPTASSRWYCGEKTTRLFVVTSRVFGGKSLHANGRLLC